MKKINLTCLLFKKIKSKNELLILLLFLVCSSLNAQEVLIASGNNISNNGQSASYSVGQIVQNMNTGLNGSAIQGIQFYFSGSSLNIIDLDTNLNIMTYPNPTASILNIKTQNSQNGELLYKLYNLLGEFIIDGQISNESTKINVDNLPVATYLLKIYNKSNQNIKTFKITKNN